MVGRVGRHSCAYRPCRSKTGQGISMFSFPTNRTRCEMWIKACLRTDLMNKKMSSLRKNHKLCERHFENKYLCNRGIRKLLFDTAIPTIFEHRRSQNIQILEAPVTDFVEVICSDSPEPSSESEIEDLNALEILELPPSMISDEEKYSSDLDEVISSDSPKPSSESEIEDLNALEIVELPSDEEEYSCDENEPSETTSLRTMNGHSNLRRTRTLRTTNELNWDRFKKLARHFLNKPLAELLIAQGLLQKNKPNSKGLNKFALTLYFLGSKAYNYLSNLLSLPSKRDFEKLSLNLASRAGLQNESVFKAIKIKTDIMPEQERHCLLCLGEVPLKSSLYYHTGRDEIVGFPDMGVGNKDTDSYARSALIMMVRGLCSNWKQPIAYFFLKNSLDATELRSVVEECLKKLSLVGLFVDGLVTDVTSNFLQLANVFGVTPNNSQIVRDGIKLQYFFDTGCLMKITRNNLIDNSFCFNDKKTSWKYVEAFYDKDQQQLYKLGRKLTRAHIHPSRIDKTKVSLATQVISRTVACGIFTHIRFGQIPANAMAMVEFIDKFNSLFDLLNSPFKSNTDQLLLDEMVKFILNLKVLNKKGQDITLDCSFLNCWIITINSTKTLWQTLSAQQTRRVNNNDCLETFRQHQSRPTPIQFQRQFRKLFCRNYLDSQLLFNGNKCDDILKNVSAEDIVRGDISCTFKSAVRLNNYDYRHESDLISSSLCNYLLENALKLHTCGTCARYCQNYAHIIDNNNKGFVFYVYELEKCFTSKFSERANGIEMSRKYFQEMLKIQFSHPCSMFPLSYVIKLFIRLKIFYSLRYSNRVSKGKKDKKVRILSHFCK